MNITRLLPAFLLTLFVALPLSAKAITLDEAKSQGLVGEQPSGYLGAVKPSPEVTALVTDINAKRRVKYQEIAQQNGTALSAVEALAGKKAIESSPSGSFVRTQQGSWVKR